MEHATHTTAWQPLTFGGVAAFAYAALGRLISVQCMAAVLAAVSTVVLFQQGWNPSIKRAIDQLPDEGGIRNGELHWTAQAPARFGEGSFVSFVVVPDNTSEVGQNADVDWLLTRRELRARSVFGDLSILYTPTWEIRLQRAVLKPWWGAWHGAVLASIAMSVAAGVSLSWWLLAMLYVAPVRLLAFYVDRDVTWGGAWRLCNAALLPGAVFMSCAIFGYTFHWLNLLQLLTAGIGHLVIGWVFVVGGTLWLRPLIGGMSRLRPGNPFSAANGK